MNGFVDDYLRAIAPHIPKTLISSKSLSYIHSVAQTLPNPITDFFGFECRLGEKAAQADFLLSVKADNWGREILAGYKSEPCLPAANFNHPVWQTIRKFSRQWANPSSPLYNNVHNIWLEYDLDRPPAKIPIPSLFFGSRRIQANTIEYQWISQIALKVLLGRSLSKQAEKNLETCFKCLPPGAEVFQIGVMLARESDAVRVCIKGMKSDRIIEYLNCIGMSETGENLKELMAELPSFVDEISLCLDVGNKIFPKIGLECYSNFSFSQVYKWKPFLDYLVDNQLCLAEKREALLIYPGISFEQFNSEIWPAHLSSVSQLLGMKVMSYIVRNIHHIKIVYQPEKPLEVKAYLYVNQGLLSRSLLKQQSKELPHVSV